MTNSDFADIFSLLRHLSLDQWICMLVGKNIFLQERKEPSKLVDIYASPSWHVFPLFFCPFSSHLSSPLFPVSTPSLSLSASFTSDRRRRRRYDADVNLFRRPPRDADPGQGIRWPPPGHRRPRWIRLLCHVGAGSWRPPGGGGVDGDGVGAAPLWALALCTARLARRLLHGLPPCGEVSLPGRWIQGGSEDSGPGAYHGRDTVEEGFGVRGGEDDCESEGG